MGHPRVSVVIRTHNRTAMLRDALQSVIDQHSPPDEIVVVDDASTEDVLSGIEDLIETGPPATYVRLDVNRGRGGALAAGVHEARGEWVACLDSDDIWLPDHIRQWRDEVAADPSAWFAFSRYGLVDESLNRLVDVVREPRVEPDRLTRALLMKEVIVHPSRSFYRREALIAVGELDLDGTEDWVTHVLISHDHPVGVRQLPQRTVLMRLHGDQSYSQPDRVRRALEQAEHEIASRVPVPTILRRRVRAINELHSALFYWQAGRSRDAMECLVSALRVDGAIVRTRTFTATASRLIVPAALGRLARSLKRRLQRSMS